MATFVCRVGVPPGADRQLAVCLTSEPKARAAVGAAVRARLRIGSMVDEESWRAMGNVKNGSDKIIRPRAPQKPLVLYQPSQ